MHIVLADIPALLSAQLGSTLAHHHRVTTLQGDVRSLVECAVVGDADIVIHGLSPSADDIDRLDSATRGTWNLLTTTTARRYILLSSMRIFEQYAPGWQVDETWSPRPTTEIDQLAPYLAEAASREICRIRPVECLVLRLDEVVSANAFTSGPAAPRWLHVEDAVSAIVRAIDIERPSPDGAHWVPYHIVRGDADSRFPKGATATSVLGFVAQHHSERQVKNSYPAPTFPSVPPPLDDLPPAARILILGAGGPIGAAATDVLRHHHRLRLAGRRSMAEVAGTPPQSEGAPLPKPVEPPHEERSVDVTDATAVLDAAQDMDAVINLTVLRPDPVEAFRVNTLGAYHVMRAAVHHGIRRVVHTGPVLTLGPYPAGYTQDRDIAANVPPRPGDNLYFISKFLGQEICRVFAEHYAIACPALLYCGFVDPATAARREQNPHPFSISWGDSGRSLAAAVRVTRMPRPFEVVHILADSPHDRYRNDDARRLLEWEPQDNLDHLWYRH